MTVYVKMLLHPARQKFNTFNTFCIFTSTSDTERHVPLSRRSRERGVGGEGSHQPRPRGSSASRSPSPTKLIASTAIVSVSPGAMASTGTWT
jgi:hypothetical protein